MAETDLDREKKLIFLGYLYPIAGILASLGGLWGVTVICYIGAGFCCITGERLFRKRRGW